MNHTVTMLICSTLLFMVACAKGESTLTQNEPPSPPDTGRTIAYVSWGEKLLLVASDDRGEVAERWHIEDPNASEWQLEGAHGQRVDLFVADVPNADFLDEHMPSVGDVRLRTGMACTGDPPDTDDTGCAQQPGNGTWHKREQTTGFALCENAQPDDRCEETYVQVGDLIYYSDRCQSEVRRVPYHRWVCFP